MDHYQRNMDDDYSTIAFKDESLKNFPKIQKQEARPLGTCVRKCIQCRQLKHILLAECTVCFRMMDIDLKDCKCQIYTSRNIIEHFICSICNSELTLDGYIICANRTCQTTLSALIKNESINEIEEISSLSTILTDICYPKLAYRTVAVQINTLNNLLPLQRFESTNIDDKSKELSSSSWSKGDLNQTIIISSDSSGTSYLSMDSGVDASLNDIARNMTIGFNSNQPTKLTLQSEDESQKPLSPIHNLTNTTDITINNSPEFTEIPKSPRCLAIMNVRQRRNRLSTLLPLSTNKTCQTQLSCLEEIDKTMIEYKELSDVTIIRTNNPNKIERQIQVDTINGHFDDLCQVRIEISDRIDKDWTVDRMNDERILRALIDRDGQRWSELIDQLINEQSNVSPSDKAQKLLDVIEYLHSTGKLNSLTTGQLQRKVRYAMSQFKHFDERSYLQNHSKTTKNTRSRTNSRRNSECNGRIDMAVTVRQIDKSYTRQTEASSEQNWKPYVDRLFEQGVSANEIQRLLHQAAKTTMQNDDQRLQDVFNYINIKANQQRAKTAPSRITSVETAKSVARQQFSTKNLFYSAKPNETKKNSDEIMTRSSPSVSERKRKSNESSSNLNNKDQDLTITKKKSSSPNNNLSKSNLIQAQPMENRSIIDFNEDEIEPNVSLNSSPDQEHKDTMTNPSALVIEKKQSINNAEITIKQETGNEKKSTTDNVAVNLEEKTNPIPKKVESITPKSKETPLTNIEEKCINALHDIENSLDNIHNTDVRFHLHPSNTRFELNKLIIALESHLHKSDNIEILMTKCVEHLNNEKEIVKLQLKESEFRNLNEKISNTLNLLQEYKRIVIPMKVDHEDSSFLKQQINTSDYQDIVNPIRCRPIPYTSSNEKGSTATLEQLLVCSTEHVSLKYQDLDEQLISNETDVKYASNKSLKTESNSYSNQSQIAWLDSLLSKISNNISTTSDIISASPSLSVTNQVKVDLNEDQHEWEQKPTEPINMERVDKQIPKFNNHFRSSISIDQQTKNILATTNDSQSTLYETDVIRLEEEHTTSIIVPDQDISILNEQFQVVQTKLSQLSKSEDQITPIQNKISHDNNQKELSNLNYDSNETSRKSPSVNNDQPQSMTTPSSSHSNIDLSEQLDQLQMHENTISSQQQLVVDNTSTSQENFESSQKQFNSENDENTSFGLAPEHMTPSTIDSNADPVTSTKSSSSSNDQENEEKQATDENKDQNLMKTNESSVHIEKTPDSSQSDIQSVDKHASKAISQIMSQQNDINKLRLPISAQHLSSSNSIKSSSLLTDLHDQDDTNASKNSISSDHSSVKTSSYNSENQNNDDKQSLNDKIDNMVNAVIHAPVMLPPNFSIAQQPANIVLSPLRTTRIEDNKYKKLITPSSFPLQPTPASTTTLSKEKELASKHDSIPRLFIEEPSGSATPLIHAVIADDDHIDKRPDTSATSSIHTTPIDNRTKDNLRNKSDRDKDKLQTEENLSVFSNTSKQESNSFDDLIRTPPLTFETTGITDEQQSKTLLTISKRYSRPKILVEDIQSPPVITPHSSVLTMVHDDDTRKKSKQQLEEDTKSSSLTVDDEKQSNKTPAQSYLEEKSSSNEIIPNLALENIPTAEHSTTKYDKSEENPNVHSSFRSQQSQHEEDDPSKKARTLRIESLIKLLPSPPDQQSMDDNHSETEDTLDQSLPPYLIDYENQSKGRLVNRKPSYPEQHLSPMTPHSIMNRVKWPSSVVTQKPSRISAIPAVLPSPVINIKMQERKLKSQLTSLENKNDKSISDLISVSSFNLAHLTDLTPNNHHETEDKYSPLQSEKSLPDDIPHPIKSKQQSSSTNSLVRSGMPSSSVPKLLLKRSSIKQPSTILSSMKPNTTLSITDVSTSSSNTIATDHLLTTHSTISEHEVIIPLKKSNSKNGFTTTSESISKRNILRKTSRPLQNQSFVSENRKERHAKGSKKKFSNNNLVTNSELIDDTKSWIKSHDDISQIFMMNEQDEKKPQIYERQRKKQNKNRTFNRSRMSPSKLKVDNNHHQTYTLDSSRLPNIEQTHGEHHLKKISNTPFHRPIIRLPVTQIEKFECGTIGPHLHPSSIAHQIFSLPSIFERPQFPSEITESFTDRLYSLISSENNTDEQAFESILHWQDHQHLPKFEQNKYQYMYVLDTSTENSVRGKQYPILTDEIDMIDDPYACTIMNKWAFADLVNNEREKCIQKSIDNTKKLNSNKHIKICLRKRPLTSFEENILKEVDIINIIDSQTLLLHIPSITVDNQVFIKNRKFKFDQTFNEHCSMNTIYHSTLVPLLDMTINGNKCLCLIGGGKYSGKTYLLRSLIDLFTSDFNRLLSNYDIHIKLLGICHNRIVDILKNYSPIRLIKSKNRTLIPNVEFHIENNDDIDYIKCQIKKRRRFMHQLIEIDFHEKQNQSINIGSLMIVVLASSQYVYTRNLCSHRRKFLINSLNKTILSLKRALLGIRQNSDRIRIAFNNDILTRLIQPYVFHSQSNICYIGTLNPGHRHRIATKSTLEFARNLRFCLKYLNKKQRRRQRKNYT